VGTSILIGCDDDNDDTDSCDNNTDTDYQAASLPFILCSINPKGFHWSLCYLLGRAIAWIAVFMTLLFRYEICKMCSRWFQGAVPCSSYDPAKHCRSMGNLHGEYVSDHLILFLIGNYCKTCCRWLQGAVPRSSHNLANHGGGYEQSA
jgi:hypothetical protein